MASMPKMKFDIELGPEVKRVLKTVDGVTGAISSALHTAEGESQTLQAMLEGMRNSYSEMKQRAVEAERELHGTRENYERQKAHIKELRIEIDALRSGSDILNERIVELDNKAQELEQVRRIVNLRAGAPKKGEIAEAVEQMLIPSNQYRAFVRGILMIATEAVDSDEKLDPEDLTKALLEIKEHIERNA